MLEESHWHSHYIVTAIAATILKDHLGYDVVFNAPDSTGRVFERAAFEDSPTAVALEAADGAQLRALEASGGPAYYMNMEVWGSEMSKQASSRKYAKHVEKRSGLGYDGREGWFMPAWVTEACNALAYTAFKEWGWRVAAVRSAFEEVGAYVDCPGAGHFANMSVWCPRRGRMKVLEASGAFSQAFQQELILNNGFNIAMVLKSPSDLERAVYAKVDGSEPDRFEACGESGRIEPFMAYYWEPTIFAARSDVERILLPTRTCGRFDGGSGTWKCDFPHESIAKVASKSVTRHAPLLADFLAGFTVPDIKDLLLDFANRSAGAAPSSDHYWAIACDWVRRNEDLWITWTATRRDLPGWSMVWDPLNFFLIFFGVFIGLLAFCFLSESLCITGQSTRKRGNVFGWRADLEVGLPLVPWLLGLTGKAFSRSRVAPEEPKSSAMPLECPVLWASSAFYGRMTDGAVGVCLLRFGDEAQLAKALTVHISTEDGTMKAGATGHYPGYKPLRHAELRFEPNRCAAWTSVKLLDNGFWGTELRFRVVVDGSSVRGSRCCTCVVRDYERRWPRRTLREPNGFSVGKNLGFSLELLLLVAQLHGWRQETMRLVYCVIESLYDTVGVNYLFNVYVIHHCIEMSHHMGLFYVAIVHGIALCFKRCKSWRFTVSGTSGIRLAHKNLATMKAFDSGMDPTHHEASVSRIFHLHTKVVDDSLPVFYTAAYSLLDDGVTLVAAPIYIVAMGARTSPQTGDLARLTLFHLVPLLLMIGISAHTAIMRKVKDRDNLLEEMMESHDAYMDHLDQATEMRPMISLYGPESTYNASATLHNKGTMHFTRPWMQNIYFRMDTIFMLDAVGTCTYAAALVALALLHIESKDFGSCRFELSHLLLSLQLFTKVKVSLLGLSEHWQQLYEGFHFVVDLGKYLNFDCTATERLAVEREAQLERLPLSPSLPSGEFMKQMMRPLSVECMGWKVPLGRAYMMHRESFGAQDFLSGLAGSQAGTPVERPAFVRVLRLVPGLPLHFDADDDGMLLPSELLAFAEPGRFSPGFADSLRSVILPWSDRIRGSRGRRSTFSRGLSTDADDTKLLNVRGQQLAQALLADPEVLIIDSFFSGLPLEPLKDMLRAVLDWQLGGPQCILGRAKSTTRAADPGSPPWLCRDGGVRRTLVLQLRPEMQRHFEAMLEDLPRISVEGLAPKVLEPNLSQAAPTIEQGEEEILLDEEEVLLLPTEADLPESPGMVGGV